MIQIYIHECLQIYHCFLLTIFINNHISLYVLKLLCLDIVSGFVHFLLAMVFHNIS